MDLHDRLFGRPPAPDDDARWAESGAMALTGPAAGPPALPPSSLVPAVLAMADTIAVTSSTLGRPVELDGLALLGERAALSGLSRRGQVSCGGATQLHRSADGWVALSLARPDDVELLPAWLGDDELAAAIARRTGADLVATGAELGLPCAALGEVTTTARPAFIVSDRTTGPRRRSLEGVVVADLSSLWAGPLCADVLGRAGARVVKVESAHRPDGARRGPAAFYDLLHAGHESVALDFRTAAGVGALRRLLARADVVIEASRPRALRHLGIDAAQSARDMGTLWLSITGHGRTGDGAHRVAFGDDAAVAGGLVAGRPEGPWFCADAVADPLTGLLTAAVALELLRDGGGAVVDVAMAAVAAWCARRPVDVERSWTGAVAAARARPVGGTARAHGADTATVLADLGIPPP